MTQINSIGELIIQPDITGFMRFCRHNPIWVQATSMLTTADALELIAADYYDEDGGVYPPNPLRHIQILDNAMVALRRGKEKKAPAK